jgi:hypothetical protein
MTQLGADPDHLRGLANSLRTAAGQLDALSTGLARRLRQVHWRGPDAVSAQRGWHSDHGPQLRSAADGLLDLARRVRIHADEQERASAPSGAGSAVPGIAAPPRVEDRVTGGLDVRLGPVSAGVAGDLTIAELGPDRRRVTLSQMAAAGGVLAVGSTADLAIGGTAGAGAATNGASGELRARAGLVVRRTWEVESDRVDDLLTRLALEQAGRTVTGIDDYLLRAVDVADAAVGWLTGNDPAWDVAAVALTAVPTPVASETLAHVDVVGAAGVGWGGSLGLGARAAGVTALRVGRSNSAELRSTVVEIDSSGSAAITSTMLRRLGVSLPMDTDAAMALRLEVPEALDSADDRVVQLQVSSTRDGQLDEIRARLHFEGAPGRAAAASLGRVVERLGDGEVDGALAVLQRAPVEPTHVELLGSSGELSGGSARAGVSGGLGVGGGVSVRGQVLHLERTG